MNSWADRDRDFVLFSIVAIILKWLDIVGIIKDFRVMAIFTYIIDEALPMEGKGDANPLSFLVLYFAQLLVKKKNKYHVMSGHDAMTS